MSNWVNVYLIYHHIFELVVELPIILTTILTLHKPIVGIFRTFPGLLAVGISLFKIFNSIIVKLKTYVCNSFYSCSTPTMITYCNFLIWGRTTINRCYSKAFRKRATINYCQTQNTVPTYKII